MRTVAGLVVAAIVLSCQRGAPCTDGAPPAAASRNGRGAIPAAQRAEGSVPAAPSPMVRVVYAEPDDPAHRFLRDDVQHRHVLEQIAEALAAVRLPKQLVLQFKGCDGDSNAYYDDQTTTITFCYEYLADIEEMADRHLVDETHVQFPGSDERIPLEEAIDGPIAFVLFHEAGHAVYQLLQVPVLGREEDAADFFAASALLLLGKDRAMCHIRGAAWAYAVGAMSMMPDLSDFADIHSLDSQRYFNILCLAYGSDPVTYAPAVKQGKLPEERASECGREYRRVRYALQKLVLPSIDLKQLEYVRMKHQARADVSR